MREVQPGRARRAAREPCLTASGRSVTRRRLLLVALGGIALGNVAARSANAASLAETDARLDDVLLTTEEGQVLSGEDGALLRA